MKITIETTPKEITDLIVELQGQQTIEANELIQSLLEKARSPIRGIAKALQEPNHDSP